ncbi:MAG: hypothetical protein OCC45_03200 [Desulfotalea sp.]
MELILQIWGGLFYLTNKVLFAFAEGKSVHTKRYLKTSGWIFYILGVPAWVTILIQNHDWIAASIEAGGVPAMFLGLYHVYYNKKCSNIFRHLVSFCTYTSLILGLSYSLYHHGGIVSLSQILEIGVMLGFLLGGYLLAHNNSIGWIFFMLMNLSMSGLMMVQDKKILMFQQLLSLCFVVYGFYKSKRSRKTCF